MFQTKNNSKTVREDHWKTADGSDLVLLRFPMLEKTGIVRHCFTTRLGGVSKGDCATMNLSFSRGDDPDCVFENFHRIACALGVSEQEFVFTDQTHTKNVRLVTGADKGKGLTKERDFTDVDALVTGEPGIVLSAFFADCVPLYFVDPVHRAIGLGHSGWRGTVMRIGQSIIETMQKEFGTDPKDLVCAVGPSICRDCYEVGTDVAEAFCDSFAARRGEILKPGKEDGKYMLDLWQANRIVLTEAGVKDERIAVTNLCTCCNGSVLFSHRASNGRRGNMGAFLALAL